MASTDRTLQWLQQGAHAWKIRFSKFTMSILHMDNQLRDMFTTIAGSRKTKQTSHLPTWLVSVDFQQLQFLAFLSLTFSSLSFSTRKERVVNICYIIAKIYSICAELFSDYTPMIPYGVREWSWRVYETQDAKMTSYRVLFFSYQTYSIHFALSHFRYRSQWLLKKKGHKGTGRQACHQYSCHL